MQCLIHKEKYLSYSSNSNNSMAYYLICILILPGIINNVSHNRNVATHHGKVTCTITQTHKQTLLNHTLGEHIILCKMNRFYNFPQNIKR